MYPVYFDNGYGDSSSDTMTGTRFNRLAVTALIVIVAIGLLSVFATPVLAHSYLGEATPGNGDHVDSLPSVVELEFRGDGVQTADVQILGPDNEDAGGEARIDGDDRRLIVVPIEDDPGDGIYSVSWEVLADDGHTTSDTYFFTVGDEEIDANALLAHHESSGGGDISVLEAIANGLVILSVIAMIGIPLAAALAVYPVAQRFGTSARPVDYRLTRVLGVIGVALIAGVVLLGLARRGPSDPLAYEPWVAFGNTSLGTVWILQLSVAIGLSWALLDGARERLPRHVWLSTSFVGGVFIAFTLSWTSHSATLVDRLQGTIVDFAHIAGAAFWIGGLLVLAIAVPPLLDSARPSVRNSLAAGTIARYSVLAVAGLVLAGSTGLLLVAWHVTHPTQLIEEVYGVALSVKVLLVLFAIGLGGFTRMFLLRRLDPRERETPVADQFFKGTGGRTPRPDGGRELPDPTVRTDFVSAIRFEVVILVAVIVVTGLLTAAPTAALSAADGADDGLVTLEDEVNDRTVELTIVPADGHDTDFDGTPEIELGDPALFDVSYFFDGELTEAQREVGLVATHTDSGTEIDSELEETDDGSYATVQPFTESGTWEVELATRVADEGVGVSFELNVTDPDEGSSHDTDDSDHDDADNTDHDDADDSHYHDGPAQDDHHDDDVESHAWFLRLTQLGALGIGIVGSIAVFVEVRGIQRRDDL